MFRPYVAQFIDCQSALLALSPTSQPQPGTFWKHEETFPKCQLPITGPCPTCCLFTSQFRCPGAKCKSENTPRTSDYVLQVSLTRK